MEVNDKRQMFFSGRNKSLLLFNLNRDFAGISPDQAARLDRTLGHYMREIYKVNTDKPIPLLNRETLAITKQDFGTYLTAPPAPRKVKVATPPPATNMGTPIEQVANERLMSASGKPTVSGSREFMFQDTGRTLDQLQKERAGSQPERPPIPDFRILSEDENGPSAMDLYEMAKRAREAEAKALPPPVPATQPQAPPEEPPIEVSLRTVVASRLPAPIETKKSRDEPPLEPPARIAMPLSKPVGTAMQTGVSTAMQNTLIREENVLQYKETEQNLFINSADRNWVQSSLTSMNRYNFTINFDPAAINQNPTLNPSTYKKFKNIVRVELVKLIVPKETLDILLQRSDVSTSATNIQTNVLSFPSVVVQVDELDGNNYGTNDTYNRAFGIVHYDAQWSSDPSGGSLVTATALTNTTTGYVSLIPKFLKCQKVYEPTPLATLQKLTIRLQRPDNGALLSDTTDVLAVSQIRFGSGVGAGPPASIYRSASDPSSYIYIRTSTYFNRYMWEAGDRLRFSMNVATPTASATTIQTISELLTYLNDKGGQLLVAVGYSADLVTVTDGFNSVGYANVLIVRNRFNDPALGSTTAYDFGDESAMNTALAAGTYTGNTINLNHQVQAVFRIVTRDLDPTTKIRPDNTY
jgi:hypothetical protein